MGRWIDRFVGWQKRRYSFRQKLLFVLGIYVPTCLLFFLVLPFWLSKKMENLFAPAHLLPSGFNVVLGAPLSLLGVTLVIWFMRTVFTVGQGTPAPFMPTQKLITTGPFAYTRNPGVLGIMICIFGLGTLLNSLSFIVLDLILPCCYLVYIKRVEEKELAARFGQAYLEYKNRTPFLIPTFRR